MYQAKCRGLFEVQDALNRLWITCVVDKAPLSVVAARYQYSLDALISDGFNRNMLTRERWLDIESLAKLGGFQVLERLKVDVFQYHSWRLSVEELQALQIDWQQIADRFGGEFLLDECQRLRVWPELAAQFAASQRETAQLATHNQHYTLPSQSSIAFPPPQPSNAFPPSQSSLSSQSSGLFLSPQPLGSFSTSQKEVFLFN